MSDPGGLSQQPLSEAGQHGRDPEVAMSADGTTQTITWRRSDGANSRVQATTSTDSGQTWSDVETLSEAGQKAVYPAFPSRADARAAYRTKALFARWDSEAFEGYLEGGLAQVEEGVALACRPDVEADVFVGSADTGLSGRAHELDLSVRLVISDDPGEGLVEAMRVLPGMIPNVTTSYLAGTNHLVVMEQPNLVAREVGEHLALLGFGE